MTSFELFTGTKMKLKNDQKLRSILEEQFIEIFQQERLELRDEAVYNIMKIQQENKKAADRKRKVATSYKDGDLVAILRTQRGPGLKIHPEFFGPYKIISVL